MPGPDTVPSGHALQRLFRVCASWLGGREGNGCRGEDAFNICELSLRNGEYTQALRSGDRHVEDTPSLGVEAALPSRHEVGGSGGGLPVPGLGDGHRLCFGAFRLMDRGGTE